MSNTLRNHRESTGPCVLVVGTMEGGRTTDRVTFCEPTSFWIDGFELLEARGWDYAVRTRPGMKGTVKTKDGAFDVATMGESRIPLPDWWTRTAIRAAIDIGTKRIAIGNVELELPIEPALGDDELPVDLSVEERALIAATKDGADCGGACEAYADWLDRQGRESAAKVMRAKQRGKLKDEVFRPLLDCDPWWLDALVPEADISYMARNRRKDFVSKMLKAEFESRRQFAQRA